MRELIKKYLWAMYCYYLLTNFLSRFRWLTRRCMVTDSGTPHAVMSIDSSLAYIHEVFGDYKKYSDVDQFSGRVSEVGPGDNCGVGLLFLADGCDSIDLVDRFYSRRDSIKQGLIYKTLIAQNSKLALKLGRFDVEDEDSFLGLKRYYGECAAAERFFQTTNYYRFIVSRAVLEHVYEPLLAIERMINALESGGMLLHKVDLRDHGMFSTHLHELSFLEVPDLLYRWMTIDSGRPNRVLIDSYREILTRLVPNHKILITNLAGIGDIEPHLPYAEIDIQVREESLRYVRSVRDRFSARLRLIPVEDLSVSGIFIVARKS